jgi:hypothetical protein
MVDYIVVLLRRSTAPVAAMAVLLVVGIQAAVRPDRWLGSYHLTAAVLNNSSTLACGAVCALAAASGLVRDRRNDRALDQMSSRSLIALDGLRLLACMITITVAFIALVTFTFALSSLHQPGHRLGLPLLFATWANLLISASFGFGLGRLLPHPALPPVIFVAFTLYLGYGSTSDPYSLPNYNASFMQEATWYSALVRSLFGTALAIAALLAGHLRTRRMWRDAVGHSARTSFAVGSACVGGLLLISSAIPSQGRSSVENSAPSQVCRTRDAIEACVWDDRTEYLESHLSMLVRVHGVLRTQPTTTLKYAEAGLEKTQIDGIEYTVRGNNSLDVDSISPARLSVAVVAEGLARNWPEVADSCGKKAKLDPVVLANLLVEASRRDVDDVVWRRNLGLNDVCS